MFSADKALVDPSQDLLGHARVAKHIAEAISNTEAQDGWVTAVHGPWGSGKTSVQNFVLQELRKLPDGQRPLIFKFSPWMYDAGESLTATFLAAFQTFLLDNKVVDDNVAKGLSQIRGWIGKLRGSTTLAVGPVNVDMDKLLSADPEKTKENLSRALLDAKRRIVVVIDDVDRLSSDEIRGLFRAVKAVADFPYVIYLMFFDRDVVGRALAKIQEGASSDYIEKIVQVGFELPAPSASDMRELFVRGAAQIFEATPPTTLLDERRFINMFVEGLQPLLDTPRKVTRLLNLVALTWKSVANEVNAVDYVGVSAIQLFAPNLYRFIQEQRSWLVGEAKSQRESAEQALMRQAIDACGSHAPAYEALLAHLFPTARALFRNVHYGAGAGTGWFLQRRVCSDRVFDSYFRFAPSPSELSNVELQALISEFESASDFKAHVLDIIPRKSPSGRSMIRPTLTALWDHAQKFASDRAERALRSLYDVADTIVAADPRREAMFETDTRMLVLRLAYQLILRIPEERRHSLLRNLIETTPSLEFAIYHLGVLEQHFEPDATGTPYVSKEVCADLVAAALVRITSAVEMDHLSLIHHQSLASTLYRWRDWAGIAAPKAWVDSVLAGDEHIAAFVGKFVQTMHTTSFGEATSIATTYIAIQDLEEFTNVESLIVRSQAKVDAGDEDAALGLLLTSWEQYKQRVGPFDRLGRGTS